jgi:hypothetical protein
VTIVVTCQCGRKLQIQEQFAGKEGQCPACGRMVTIPVLETSASTFPGAAVDLPPMPSYRPVVELEPEPVNPSPAPSVAEEPVNNHGGDALPPDADFFVPAPEQIGPVASAYTTLRQGVQPMTPSTRLVVGSVAAAVGLIVGLLIDQVFHVRNEFWLVAWPIGLGGIAILIALVATHFAHTCTYVGRDGAARSRCSGDRDQLTTQELFLFREATELRTSQTLHYTNNVYQHTTYAYTWTDVGGRVRYVISGQHNSEAGTPPSTHEYHYARAAEIAWTVYLLNDAYRQLELSDAVPFNLRGGKWVRLGKGKITICLGGEPQELDAADIAAARVERGTVSIRRVDAQEGWFSSHGVYKFPFDELANAQLFFHLLDKVVGVSIG